MKDAACKRCDWPYKVLTPTEIAAEGKTVARYMHCFQCGRTFVTMYAKKAGEKKPLTFWERA